MFDQLTSARNIKQSRVTITSGAFRGRKLATPDTAATHPMGSREKLALFNALISAGADLTPDTRVLDVYAGSGALGLEAISRGAGSAVFVDNNAKARAAIKENAKNLGISAEIFGSISDFASHSEPHSEPRSEPHSESKSAQTAGSFDIILADPPYDNFPADLSFLPPLLKSGGFLALSHPTSVDAAEILPGLELVTTKSHAASRLSIFYKQ